MRRRAVVALAVAGLSAMVGCGGAPLDAAPCTDAQARGGGACVDEAKDPGNCGGCGLTCDQCTNGRCIVVLASGQSLLGSIAVSSTEVVWTSLGVSTGPGTGPDGTSLVKVPLGGGTPETLALSARWPISLALDSGYAYWTMQSSLVVLPSGATDDAPDGTVMRIPLEGGAPTVLASSQISPTNVAVHAGTVYWTARGGLMSVPTTGGAPTVVVPGQISSMVLSASRAYWADADGVVETKDLAADAPELTLTDEPNPAGIFNLAVSSTSLYWTVEDPGNAFVKKLPLGGGASTVVFTAAAGTIDFPLAVDGDHLYWANRQPFDVGGTGGRITKALADGSTVAVSPTGKDIRGIAVDATSVYFADVDQGAIIKVTPK